MSNAKSEIDYSYWQGKRVLITGHSGFKGSWLTVWLQKLGCIVSGLSLAPNTNPSLFQVAGLSQICNSYELDVRDLQQVKLVFDREKPEIVFHLAAQALVRQSYIDPIETFSTNFMGTVNVLEAIRQSSSIRAAIMVTTDKVYLNRESLQPYHENDSLGGHDPYSASKASCELVIESYRKSYLNAMDINVASARAGNVIGGGDWATNRLIPDAVRAWSEQRSLLIRHPDSIRPWQHVLEPLHAYIILAQQLEVNSLFATAYNFGPSHDEAASVRSVIEMASACWGNDSHWSHDEDTTQLHEASLLRLDTTKAFRDLGIEPVWDIKHTIKKTVDWYKQQQYLGVNSLDLCRTDIQEFEMYAERKYESAK